MAQRQGGDGGNIFQDGGQPQALLGHRPERVLDAPKCRDVTWEQVLEEERQCIERLRSLRPPEPSAADGSLWPDGDGSSKRFSLAFSGGGLRAAAFQAGVLWRLAQEDRLKDVDYLVAVSGGSYIASAFASHCVDEDPPLPGECSRDWYLKVVAKTLCRMQTNGGNFVRDIWAKPSKYEAGAGKWPRWFDIPVLCGVFVFALPVAHAMFVIGFLVPPTIMVDLFFGPVLRALYCDSRTGAVSVVLFVWEHSPINVFVLTLVGLCIATFTVFFVRRCCGGLRPIPSEIEGRRPTAPWGFQTAHALQAYLVRSTIFLFFVIVFIFLLNYIQGLAYTDHERTVQCNFYIHQKGYETQTLSATCANTFPPGATEKFWDWANFSLINQTDPDKPDFDPDGTLLNLGFFKFMALIIVVLASIAFCCCLLTALVGGGGLTVWFVANVVGPCVFIVASLLSCEFSVYGPITGNSQGSFLYWQEGMWRTFVFGALCAMLISTSFFEGVLHSYYKRTLRQNFFCHGKDVRFSDLVDQTRGGARMCPFLITTVTARDYQSPGDTGSICELSLSSLHLGSHETGYIRQPPWFSLAKSNALASASHGVVAFRFWLQSGDYILFEGKSRLYDFAERMGKAYHSDVVSRLVIQVVHRSLSGIVWLLFYILQICAFAKMVENNASSCRLAADLLWTSLIVFNFVLFSSFFSFCYFFDLFTLSTISRLILQATKYIYVGNRPPRMLYVSDGGFKDCTGLLQLIIRRRQRIVLALAVGDRDDDLEVLKTTIEVAQQAKMGSFFDPEFPQRSLTVLLDRFKRDKSMMHLHLGIRYSWCDEAGGAKLGDLWIVKHRLPPGFEGMPVQPPLTEAEIIEGQTGDRGEAPERLGMEEWGDLTTDQLGAYGCCDCCHTRGWNCGNPFPHGVGTVLVYLTPMWVNSLARLGFGASKQALADCSAAWRSGERSSALGDGAASEQWAAGASFAASWTSAQ